MSSPYDRLAGKYHLDPDSDCLIWHAGLSSQGRYPTISTAPHGCQFVHRLVWELTNGPWPTDLPSDGSDRYELHHTCGRRLCVNASHIKLLTRRQHVAAHARIRQLAKVDLLRAQTRKSRSLAQTSQWLLNPSSIIEGTL